MKKVIIAAAIVLTTGVLTVITKENSNTSKSVTIGTTSEKNVVATAD